MVYAAAGDDTSTDEAYRLLRLTFLQQEIMTNALMEHQIAETRENENILKHQTMVTEALTGPDFLRVREDAFRKSLDVHLYQKTNPPDTLFTVAEFSKAKSYMHYHNLAFDQLDDTDTDSTELEDTGPSIPRSLVTNGVQNNSTRVANSSVIEISATETAPKDQKEYTERTDFAVSQPIRDLNIHVQRSIEQVQPSISTTTTMPFRVAQSVYKRMWV